MNDSLQRIYDMPLKADGAFVRGVSDNYHVTTISSGMNDREEYARLFAAAPVILESLQALSDEIVDLRRSGAIGGGQDAERIDQIIVRARSIIATAI